MVLGFRKATAAVVPDPVSTSPAPTDNIDAVATIASSHDVEDRIAQLKKFEKLHRWDLHLTQSQIESVSAAIESGDVEKEVAMEHALLEEDSPYPEVRASVRNFDEDMPANTIRAWIIGILLTTVASAVNMLFSLRNPSIVVTTFAIQLVAYPLGLGWDLIMPKRKFRTFGIEWSLNPSPFNLKEHTIIVVMANASFGGGNAYATDVLLAQEVMYGQRFGWAFQILLVITTQVIGFGLAGMCRRFLVWPASMVWPSTLANTTLFYALHDHSASDPSKTDGWSIGRYRWFLYVFLASFIWYWFPGWIAQFLSYFVFPTWIAPQNVVVNQIFGGFTGLGIIPLTFDWTVVTAFLNSPLIFPWFSIANGVFGVLIFFFFTALGIHYSGSLYSDYLPMQDTHSYDNTGNRYNVSLIMNPDLTLNETAYKAYSPLFLSTNFSISYGVSFAIIAAVLVYTALYNGREVWERARLARNQDADVHMKMMGKYRDSPDWWYLAVYVVLFALSLATVLNWDTHLAWWAFIICMLIPAIFLIPIGMVQAVGNFQIGLNVLTEFIIGYMQPGRPLAMMIFKTYGYITMAQALYFLQDLKLAHYMKVPPRTVFFAQCIATFWSSIVQVSVYNWAIGAIPKICTPQQPNNYTCPSANTFYTASVIWGAIGPGRIFSPGSIYAVMQWYWLLGAMLPIFTYAIARKWPRSFVRYIHVPLMLGTTGWIPPATCYIYFCWGTVGFIFNFWIKRRWAGWWSQYNFVTSAALDTGLFVSTLVIFFALQLRNINPPQWWGNVDVFNTLDATDKAVRIVLPPGETFGPPPGSW